ncbi:bifunctional DNA-formamidopyrimidine glycosylase/DNA-(apurinic or apyrimidinic site) lyase [Gammaproteobacteria bacterium]|nr:bifunctional DNA-formamidopyrimidine glycosylase/DNA-(apurinic or apyrimidinic site) lyase [Gammaproteobacteria bacterium]
MPELPEVETSVQAIQEFANQNIESIEIYNPNLRWKVDCNTFKNLSGLKVSKIDRRAKYILFHLNQSQILIHLGMTGTLRIAKKESNFYKKHDHVEFIFQRGKLIFNDPRRFGSIHFITEPSKHFLLEKLGPEPLSEEFNGEYLFQKIKKSLSPIKNSLMNQHNVVGIGNIYANEILFDAKIRPTRKSKTITKKEYNKIAASTKKILKVAIKAGGTTLKDFYQPDGNKGYFKIDLAVYDRANEKCKNCKKELIKRIIQSQRATFYCRKCQI